MSLFKKIVQVMNEVGQLQKDGAVTDFSGKKMYNYLSEEQTTGELQRAFVKFGLVLLPIKVEDEFFYIDTVRKGEMVKAPITKVRVTYRLIDADTGESQEIQSIGYGSDSQDKGSNKAMTGAFKYVQRQTFMISTGDDGDHTASEVLDAQHIRPSTPPAGQQPRPAQSPRQEASEPQEANSGSVAMISSKQIGLIKVLAGKKKVKYETLLNGKNIEDLTAAQASRLIEKYNSMPDPQTVGAQPTHEDELPF